MRTQLIFALVGVAIVRVIAAEGVAAPFMSEHWSQTRPYNALVPAYLPPETGDSGYEAWGGHVTAGCVATAMAQTMHFWGWPAAFSARIETEHSVNLDKGKVQFNVTHAVARGVPLVYDESDACKARLTFIAASLGRLAFDRDGTGGFPATVAEALADSYVVPPANCSDEDLRNYLKLGYPVPATITGHAIVLNGYKQDEKGNDLFYMNNGSAGTGDGWIDRATIKTLTPCFPKKMAMIKPLPKTVKPSFTLEWAFPEPYLTIYPTAFQGFTLKAFAASLKGEAQVSVSLGRDARSYTFTSLTDGETYSIELMPRFGTLPDDDPTVFIEPVMTSVSVRISSAAPESLSLSAPAALALPLTGATIPVTGSPAITSLTVTPSLKSYTIGGKTYSLADYLEVSGANGSFAVKVKPIDFLEKSDDTNLILTFTGETADESVAYAETRVNLAAANPVPPVTEEDPAPVAQDLHYTLISPPAYVAAWADYLAMRRAQRPDVEFRLVNAADIYAAYPFNPEAAPGAPRNPAESIHAWIRATMKDVTDPAERAKYYFVLGGSWAKAQGITSASDPRLETRIPNVYIQPRRAGNIDLIDDDPESPCSDMFYACLDVADGKWPWDANGNGKYADSGELKNGDNDFFADVVIARIPVEKNPHGDAKAVIAAFAEKVRAVESETFDGAYRYAAAGGQTKYTFTLGNTRTMRDEREFYDGGLNMFDPRHGGKWIDAEELPRNTMKNMVAPRRPVLEGNPLFVYGWGSEHESIDAAVRHYFTHNRDFVEYRDHGSAGDLYCKYINANAYLTSTGITRMIFSGFSCMTGHIDGDGLSLAEAEIVSLKGGTVSSVHNSRYGFGTNNVNIDDDGLSSSLQYYMKQDVLEKDMDMGSAWLEARQRYYRRGAEDGTARFIMAEQLLLGDPLIKMPPAILETTLDANEIAVTQPTGYTTLNVKGGTTIAGEQLFKVMKKLNVTDGDTLRFAADGGVGGSGVAFASGHGHLTIASPSKSYFAQPTGADEVVLAGSGTTLDFDRASPTFATLTLAGEGAVRRTGNILRGRTEGQLAGLLPLMIDSTEVALGTVDAFLGATGARLATVTNGGLGITFNPNTGLENCWEYFAAPIALENGTLFVDRTETAGFGRPDHPGLAVEVKGKSAVKTMNGGKATLFGTTAFTLDPAAELTLDAAFKPDVQTKGRLAFSGGRTIVTDDVALAGEVSVDSGTLVLTKIPLRNVTKLTLTGTAQLVIPMDGEGFYPILSTKGANLSLGEQVKIFSAADEKTPVAGQATSTGAIFDVSKFTVWNQASGDWRDTADGLGKVYFPDLPGVDEVRVNVPEALSCAFVVFGNQRSTYRFSGAPLTIGNAVLSERVVFENEVIAPQATLVTGGSVSFATLRTPLLEVASGAVVSAETIGSRIETVKGIRFYPLKTNGGDGKSVALLELTVQVDGTDVPLKQAAFSYPAELGTVKNAGALTDGTVQSIFEAIQGTSESCHITANSQDILNNGQFYLQYLFTSPIKMPTSYSLAATAVAGDNASKSLTAFRMEVSTDGINWVAAGEAHNVSVPKSGTGNMWYGGASSPTRFSLGSPATEIVVAAGGTLVLKGTVNGRLALADGAVLKVGSTAMTLGATSQLIVPETGFAVLDVSDLALAAQGEKQTVLSGGTLTEAQLAHLATQGKSGYRLAVEDGSLVVIVERHPPQILFK